MNNVMKDHLTQEQKNEILRYENDFFYSEENRSVFTKYFLCLMVASCLSYNEGLLSLEELYEDASPHFLKELFKLTVDGFWTDELSSEPVFSSVEVFKENQKIWNDMISEIQNSPDKNIQFLGLFSICGMQQITEQKTPDEVYEYLLSFIPEDFMDFKAEIRKDIAIFPDENKIQLDFHNINLQFIKTYENFQMFSEYLEK